MTNSKVNNLVRLLSALTFSSLLLSVSAQTNSTDVEALGLLQNTFPLLALISTGDPCLPIPFSWLECSSDATPRIIALNLGNSALAGVFLPDFSGLDALVSIDLSNNFLVLEFPDFLANFPYLKALNLANNFFFGTVPTSLMERSHEKTLELTLTGTQISSLCFSDEVICETGTPGAGSPATETPQLVPLETQTSFGQIPVIDPVAAGLPTFANGFTVGGIGK